MKSGGSWIFTFFLYLIIITGVACAQSPPRSDAAGGDVAETEEEARQFRVYRDSLQRGSSEDIRVDAAVGLLLKNSAKSRDVLLSALKSDKNTQARQAVCKALIKSRALSQTIDALEEFREPLLGVLKGESTEQAKLAAEALLLFDFSAVADSLDSIIHDGELSHRVHMNVVYALQLRTDPEALQRLIQLLDDPDAEAAKAAETALQEEFGIPEGASRTVWQEILDQLQLKSPEDIRKERLRSQGYKLLQIREERDRWRELYLAALDKEYEALDDAKREKAILDMIASDLEAIRIMALKKASKYPEITDDLREKLLSLLSDSSRDVRLQTAKALMNKSSLNPAEKLLEQMESESDSEVKLAMLEALGEAYFFALSPGTEIELPSTVKLRTLEIAGEYLRSETKEDCIKGAEVVRKILELNNLAESSKQSYLGLLQERYVKSISQDNTLRSELLAILAHLCGQGGAKEYACALFEPLFVDAVGVEGDDALRLAAVQGFSYVDKARALELFKNKNLAQDPSLAVQQVVIDVAGQAGGPSDLKWLLGSFSGNGHNDHIWEAMKNIFQRQEVDFLLDWLDEFEKSESVNDEYVLEILDIAENKAVSEKDEKMLKQVREKTVSWLVQRKTWEQAAAYLLAISYSLAEGLYSDQMDCDVFQVYLYGKMPKEAAAYVGKVVAVSDYDQNSEFASLLEAYFSNEDVEESSKVLFFNEISSIQGDDRPLWSAFIGELREPLNLPAQESLSESGESTVE